MAQQGKALSHGQRLSIITAKSYETGFSISRLEEKHRRGYELHPVNKEEFSVWEEEQDWGMNEEGRKQMV